MDHHIAHMFYRSHTLLPRLIQQYDYHTLVDQESKINYELNIFSYIT